MSAVSFWSFRGINTDWIRQGGSTVFRCFCFWDLHMESFVPEASLATSSIGYCNLFPIPPWNSRLEDCYEEACLVLCTGRSHAFIFVAISQLPVGTIRADRRGGISQAHPCLWQLLLPTRGWLGLFVLPSFPAIQKDISASQLLFDGTFSAINSFEGRKIVVVPQSLSQMIWSLEVMPLCRRGVRWPQLFYLKYLLYHTFQECIWFTASFR